MKVCFTASSGGHLEEISRLKSLLEDNDGFVITEKSEFSVINWCERKYLLKQVNRKELAFFPKMIWNLGKSLKVMIKEKPNVIISTGALSTIPVCIIAKIARKKIIYIESFARVDTPSMTGKLMYKIADLFLVQWEEMLSFYPKAKYVGGIF